MTSPNKTFPNKTLFHRRSSGADDESVDCWFLISKDDGTYWVEHMWWHRAATDHPGAGSSVTSVGKFFARVEDSELLGSLRAALARAVI